MKRYVVVIERTKTGFSAYLPDLPGCVATGASQDEVKRNVCEAVAFHIDGLRADGAEIPMPHTYAAYSQVIGP